MGDQQPKKQNVVILLIYYYYYYYHYHYHYDIRLLTSNGY